MSTVVKVVLWVVGGVTAIVLLGVGALVWSFSGGWDGLRPGADPEDRAVVDAREAGHEPLAALAGPVEEQVAPATPLGRAQVDECETGQNNWKVQDGWTLSCTQGVVVAAAAPATSVDALARTVDARLQALGWVPASYGEMLVSEAGDHAAGRYDHPDDPGARITVDVTAPGGPAPFLSLGGGYAEWSEGDAQPLLDAVRVSPSPTVVAVVERDYFRDG